MRSLTRRDFMNLCLAELASLIRVNILRNEVQGSAQCGYSGLVPTIYEMLVPQDNILEGVEAKSDIMSPFRASQRARARKL